MNWKEYFTMMEDWKRFPAYKAEPRIDSLFGFYLKTMATEFLEDNIEGIIPELPIRLGTVKPHHNATPFADRSYKVDFYLLGSSGKNYFVEFKTDSSSRRDKQDQYLQESQEKGMASIVDGILKIQNATSYKYKHKYAHLVECLQGLGLISNERKYSGKSSEIEIIYVQPQPRKGLDETSRIIDFKWVAQWLKNTYGHQQFESAFSEALIHWAND